MTRKPKVETCGRQVETIRGKLSGLTPRSLREEHSRRAAVLMSLVAGRRDLSFLLTLRTRNVATHKGQVSFPGGFFELADDDLLATALRETEEELGIKPDAVEVLGRFHDYLSVTRALVRPYVGLLQKEPEVRPNPAEVDEVFQAPLRFFLHTAPDVQVKRRLGREVPIYYWDFEGQTIWGLTAAMIKDFLDAMRLG